jgi:hypothetical protein
LWRRVDSQVDNVSKKHTVSIFRAEVWFYETLVSTYECTRRHNPEDQNRHLQRRQNLTSQTAGSNLAPGIGYPDRCLS